MRVLVVATEPLVAFALRDALESAGHTVIGPAKSSGEALLLSNTMRPHCAIVDAHLEREEIGVHLAQRLREQHDLRVVLTSDDAGSLQASEALRVVPRTYDAQAIVKQLPPKIATGARA